MMFWCDTYIWFTFWLNLCNYHNLILHKTMWFLCIKHEHSCISLKKNVTYVWLFKILNTQVSFILTITWNSCDFYMNLWKLNFTQNLYEPMKLGKFVMHLWKRTFHFFIVDLVPQHYWSKKFFPINLSKDVSSFWSITNHD